MLRSGGMNRGLSPTLVSSYSTNANDAAGDGPVHIYPNDAIGLGSDGPTPDSSMEWVPDYPGATTGTIKWQNTPTVAPDAQYVEYNIEVVRNGVPEPAVYTLNGKTFEGSIRANAGDVISIRQNGIAQGTRQRTIVDITGDMMPIRVPVAGQTDGGPGHWVYAGNESGMVAAPRYYQESVTHTAVPWTYQFDGRNYDGFYIDPAGGQHLLEAKGNYSWMTDSAGNQLPWVKPEVRTKLLGQMADQAAAAQNAGISVDWYLQQADTLAYFQGAAKEVGALAINFIVAPQGRPNVY